MSNNIGRLVLWMKPGKSIISGNGMMNADDEANHQNTVKFLSLDVRREVAYVSVNGSPSRSISVGQCCFLDDDEQARMAVLQIQNGGVRIALFAPKRYRMYREELKGKRIH